MNILERIRETQNQLAEKEQSDQAEKTRLRDKLLSELRPLSGLQSQNGDQLEVTVDAYSWIKLSVGSQHSDLAIGCLREGVYRVGNELNLDLEAVLKRVVDYLSPRLKRLPCAVSEAIYGGSK